MYRHKRWSLVVILLLALGLTSRNAEAHRRDHGHHHDRHSRFSIAIGPPVGWAYYPPPRYYYPPPVVVSPPPQQVYVEQAPAQNYWYYCPSPAGYYPNVKECPSNWLKVVPEP